MNVDGSFGEWLRQRRKALDLTQIDLADEVGCSVTTVRMIERGKRRPSKQFADCLFDALALGPEQRAAFVAFARRSGGPPSAPAVPPKFVPAENLPPQLTPFFGRASELAHITECLADPACRLLTLVGPGGIGKTRLALEAVGKQRSQFAHGIHFVPLVGVSSADLVPDAIASALKISLNGQDAATLQIGSYLHDQHILLVVDNFEHVLAATISLLDLLAIVPTLKLLVTSRERLNVREEWVFALEGLAFPEGSNPVVAEHYSAVQLFVQRARQVQTNFSLDENIEAVIGVCQAVEGLPLALELVATWLRVVPCHLIAGQIQRDMDFLASPLHNVLERHRTLRAVFDHSWSLLSPAERNVLVLLSVFRGGFDLDAAVQVAGASVAVLSSLVDKSLIRLQHSGRYDLHELLRQYAAARLGQSGQADATARQHLNYFLNLAERAETALFSPMQIVWFDHLDAEAANLQAALTWSSHKDKAEIGLRLAAALGWYWFFRLYFRQGLFWLDSLLTTCESASASLRVKALHHAADLSLVLHENEQAVALSEQGLALAHQAQDPEAIAWALSSISIPLANLGDLDRAALSQEKAMALFRDLRDKWGLHHALVRRAMVATVQEQFGRAFECLEESLALSRGAHDNIAIARSLEHLADSYRARDSDPTKAAVLYEESASLYEKTRDVYRLRAVLWKLSAIARLHENYEKARAFAARGLTELRKHGGEKVYFAWGLLEIGGLDLAKGWPERATRLFAAAGETPHYQLGGLTPRDLAQIESDVAAARALLGETAFATAWAEGKAMSNDEAIAYALTSVSDLAVPTD